MKLSENEIRQLLFTRLSDVKWLMITENDIKLIHYIADIGSVMATDIADYRDITIENASTKLKRLYDQGYLIRREIKSASGGIEYVYWDSFSI